MSTPLPIPQYGTTAGTYWPATGTIPKPNTSTYYVLSDETANPLWSCFILQAASNPGVDPLDLTTLPPILSQGHIVIPSMAAGDRLHQVNLVRPYDETTATVIFNAGQAPAGMVASTPTAILVIDTGIHPMEVQNIGGANATINGQLFVVGQKTIITTPVEYAAGASTLSMDIRW